MLVVNLRSIKISIGLKPNLFLLNLIQMRFNRSKSGKKLLAVGKILLHFTLVFYLKNDGLEFVYGKCSWRSMYKQLSNVLIRTIRKLNSSVRVFIQVIQRLRKTIFVQPNDLRTHNCSTDIPLTYASSSSLSRSIHVADAWAS